MGSLFCSYSYLKGFFLKNDYKNMIRNILVLVVFQFFISGFSQQKNIVLELFTSQGCSSCPNADRLLKQVSENNSYENVMVLAYHVDYWNRLGWKDPFSKASFTNYQQEYGRKFGGRSIYTPQLVINGKKHIVGSDKNSLIPSLNKLSSTSLSIPVTITDVTKKGNNVVLRYASIFDTTSRLNIVMLLKEKITEVKRGENRNRTLVDTHIVVDKKIIRNSAASEIIFENVNFNMEELEFVAYIQNSQLEITGATNW